MLWLYVGKWCLLSNKTAVLLLLLACQSISNPAQTLFFTLPCRNSCINSVLPLTLSFDNSLRHIFSLPLNRLLLTLHIQVSTLTILPSSLAIKSFPIQLIITSNCLINMKQLNHRQPTHKSD